ncbi:MAG: DUF2254 domain-containing protein [Proteobacteria bacterium]|nr:DUF2254 domain-containing protein [Pseudomonadota bacterium]
MKNHFKSPPKNISLKPKTFGLSGKTSLWLRRLTLYLVLGILVVTVSHLAFSYIGFLHTDADSARYMLSALVQSEAAIMAIVVTLSLVTVQLAASSYSVRVIEVFKRNPDLWILMMIYGFAIFYGLGVLKSIEGAGSESGLLSEGHISFAYYLGIFTFMALIVYIWNMLDLLKPATMIKILSERITESNLRSALEKDPDSDPIQPIADLIRNSLVKYESETAMIGLEQVGECANDILKNKALDESKREKLLEHVFHHIRRAGCLAADRSVGQPSLFAITVLHKNGKQATEQGLHEVAWWTELSIEWVGKMAAEQKLDLTAFHALESLEDIGNITVKQRLGCVTWWAAYALGTIGEMVAEQKHEIETLQAVKSLENVGKTAAEQEMICITWQAMESLKHIGNIAKKQHIRNAALQAETSLEELEKAAEGLEIDTEKCIKESLKMIRKAIDRINRIHMYD